MTVASGLTFYTRNILVNIFLSFHGPRLILSSPVCGESPVSTLNLSRRFHLCPLSDAMGLFF